MGFIKQVKADTMASHAARARQQGRRIFVARIQTRVWSANTFSAPMEDAAEMIEAIENQGWSLDKMSYVIKKDDKAEGIYLFRVVLAAQY